RRVGSSDPDRRDELLGAQSGRKPDRGGEHGRGEDGAGAAGCESRGARPSHREIILTAMKTLRPCLAEFLRTFYLCFAGVGALLAARPASGAAPGLLGIAPAHGLGLSIAVNVFGGISGAHFNPAVTAGFLVTGRIAPSHAAAYVVAQLLGATTAAGFCRSIFPAEAVTASNLGIPLPAQWATTGTVLTAEFIMTYLLMTSIFGTAVDDRGREVKIGGFGLGLTVALHILCGE